MNNYKTYILIGIHVVLSMTLLAQTTVIPSTLQAMLFKKIFDYDKSLQGKGTVNVLVVYNESSTIAKDRMIAAFKAVGIGATGARVGEASTVISAAHVVYVTAGVTSMRELCSKHKVLSISGDGTLADSGEVSVGLGMSDGKPKIIVNAGQLKAEGQELSADLLKMAKYR